MTCSSQMEMRPCLQPFTIEMRITMKNTSSQTTSIFSLWLRNSLFDIIPRKCNIGLVLLCGIFVERMIQKVGSGNAHTMNVESGRSFLGSLQNAGGADAPSTAAKNVKKVHGCITGIGVFQLLNSSRLSIFSILFFPFLSYIRISFLLFFRRREGFSIIHLFGYLLFLFL